MAANLRMALSQTAFMRIALLVCALGADGALVTHKIQTDLRVETTPFSVENTTRALMNFMAHRPMNISIFSAAKHELEYELHKPAPKVDKTILVVVSMLLGGLGCDRCFMGQCCLGSCKFITAGGFGIWALIDWIVIVINALSKSKDINSFGFVAVFVPESVDTAYMVALIFLLIQFAPLIIQTILACCMSGVMGATAASQAMAYRRQQSDFNQRQRDRIVTAMPATFQGTFRQYGLLQGTPSKAELEAMFQAIDKNGDGQLEKDEIKEYLGNRGVSDEDIESMIKGADKDGDGKINASEWTRAILFNV